MPSTSLCPSPVNKGPPWPLSVVRTHPPWLAPSTAPPPPPGLPLSSPALRQPPCGTLGPAVPTSLRGTGVQDTLPGSHMGTLRACPPNSEFWTPARDGWGLRAACIFLLMGSSSLHGVTLVSCSEVLPPAAAHAGTSPQPTEPVTRGSGSPNSESLLKMFFLCFVLFRNFPNFYQVKDTTTRMCSWGG